MAGYMKEGETQAQSMAAWTTWRTKWIDNCTVNKSVSSVPLAALVNEQQGKILVHAAFGYSLAEHLNLLRQHRHRFALTCCDKAFGFLVANGIIPDYCIIADASVSDEWIDAQDTSRTTLVANVAANPAWTTRWTGRVAFYVNWDNIGTANVLARTAEKWEIIPASSNVSNAQVVFGAQVLNPSVHLLVGYDYSWEAGSWYYASKDSDKRYYMHHADVVSPYGTMCETSSNLLFSCNWLMQYMMKFPQVSVWNCSGRGLLTHPPRRPLVSALDAAERRWTHARR